MYEVVAALCSTDVMRAMKSLGNEDYYYLYQINCTIYFKSLIYTINIKMIIYNITVK